MNTSELPPDNGPDDLDRELGAFLQYFNAEALIVILFVEEGEFVIPEVRRAHNPEAEARVHDFVAALEKRVVTLLEDVKREMRSLSGDE